MTRFGLWPVSDTATLSPQFDTTAMLIDTHCHLEKFVRNEEADTVLQRAHQAGVGHCITVGTDTSDWRLYAELAASRSQLDYTVGLHPCSVMENWSRQVDQLAAFWKRDKQPVALGEIGLDHFHLPKDREHAEMLKTAQCEAFAAQLELAKARHCPVVIHSRNAVAECIAMIDASGCDWSKVVFHCFSDGPEQLVPILERGGRASFTGILTFKSAQPVRDALVAQGMDRLMLETDAPYLAPEPFRGKPCEPAFVGHTAKRAAELLDTDIETLAQATTRNAAAFFNLSVSPISSEGMLPA